MELSRYVIEGLRELAPSGVKPDEPMARHTSFGLGGPVDVLVEAPDLAAFRDCAALLADEGVPTRVLGLGTNILVRSGGIDGAVLLTRSALQGIDRDGLTLTVASGTSLARLLNYCADSGLSGLEGLAGIPGSVGGAVVTNAGSHGTALGDVLLEIVGFEPGRGATLFSVDAVSPGYRRSSLPDGVVVESVRLSLVEGDSEEVGARQREFLDRKWRTQPCGMRSAGCIFKNPEEGPAGLLIDRAGLKGTRVGGAVVSDQHANFIVNDRGATPDDVERLIELMREKVREATGVELELEVELVGRRAC